MENIQDIFERVCPSKDTRKYWEKIDFKLTVMQLATIIVNNFNNYFNRTERLSMMSYLIKYADDEATKDTLQKYLDTEAAKYNAFIKKDENAVYEVFSVCEDDSNSEDNSEGLAVDFDTAMLMKEECGDRITKIVKRKLHRANEQQNNIKTDQIAVMEFTKDWKIEEIYCYEPQIDSYLVIPSIYVYLPHNFHDGDIVKNKNGQWGVVESGINQGEDFAAFEKSIKDCWKVEYEPLIVVEHLNEGGQFYHAHYDPLTLERVKEEDSLKYQFYQATSWLVTGKISLDYFDSIRERYIESLNS